MRVRVGVLMLLAGLFGWAFWANQTHTAFMDWFCREDSVVENTQAGLLLAASLICLSGLARRQWRSIWYAGFALMFFLNFGEEISWGQRIFGVATPKALGSVNVQGEMNLHNVNGITQHIRMVGVMVIFVLTVVLPLAHHFAPRARELLRRFALPVFPLWTLPITAMGVLFMVLPRLAHHINFNLDEMGELYVYVTFFLFSLSARRQALELPAAVLSPVASLRVGGA